jgi:hypothetical protein
MRSCSNLACGLLALTVTTFSAARVEDAENCSKPPPIAPSASTLLSEALEALGGKSAISALKGVAFNA